MDHKKGSRIGGSGFALALILLLIAILGNLVTGGIPFFLWVARISILIGFLFGLYGVFHFSIWEAEDFYNRFYGRNEN